MKLPLLVGLLLLMLVSGEDVVAAEGDCYVIKKESPGIHLNCFLSSRCNHGCHKNRYHLGGLCRTVEVNDATSATAVEGVRLTLFIGDTVVLKHKNLHAIYVFRSWRAFESCQLAKATVFHLPCNATFFKWSTSRRGNYYFSFNLGNCSSQELIMKIRVMGYVKINHLSPSLSPSPSPALELSPGPSPAAEDSAQPRKPFSEPWLMIPRGNGENPNFVSSNPVIPLPVGTTDDDINRSLPETGDGNKMTKLTTLSDRIQLVFFMLTPFFLAF